MTGRLSSTELRKVYNNELLKDSPKDSHLQLLSLQNYARLDFYQGENHLAEEVASHQAQLG